MTFTELLNQLFDEKHTVHCELLLRRFIWQVKRKMIDDPNYPVDTNIMPVLYDITDDNGRLFLNYFLKPVEKQVGDLQYTMSFPLADDFNFCWVKDYMIGRGNFYKDIKQRKKKHKTIEDWLIKPQLKQREFRKRTFETIDNKLSLISFSTIKVKDLKFDQEIKDKHFFEVTMNPIRTFCIIDILKQFDFNELWDSISYKENNDVVLLELTRP